MTINDMIKNSTPVNTPVVLNTVWTDKDEFCCPMMDDSQIVVDMIEAQDFIAALSVAETRGVAIPKFKATEYPYSQEESGWQSISIEIMSPITDDFMTVIDEVMNGDLEFKDVTIINNCRHIRNNKHMKPYNLSLQDNLNIINATLN